MGKTAFSIGKENLDLRYVEQLVDEEQTQSLAYLLRYAKEHYGEGKNDVGSVVKALERILKAKGLSGICDGGNVPSGLAMPRVQEIFACFNRY